MNLRGKMARMDKKNFCIIQNCTRVNWVNLLSSSQKTISGWKILRCFSLSNCLVEACLYCAFSYTRACTTHVLSLLGLQVFGRLDLLFGSTQSGWCVLSLCSVGAILSYPFTERLKRCEARFFPRLMVGVGGRCFIQQLLNSLRMLFPIFKMKTLTNYLKLLETESKKYPLRKHEQGTVFLEVLC